MNIQRIFDEDQLGLFKLFKKAYVEARYKPNYLITHEELAQLYQQVEELKKIGELICQEKINSFV